MNPVEIECNTDGRYSLTLPDGGKRPSLSAQEVVHGLKHKAQEFQKALDDIAKNLKQFEVIAAREN